jgi:ATP phosphoribosyltransferase
MSDTPYAWPAPGAADRLGVATRHLRDVEDAVLTALRDGGYVEVAPPTADVAEVFVGAGDAPRWIDPGGRVRSLRADFTGPVARIAATRFRDHDGPLRLAYRGPVFRQHGVQVREEAQAGAELFGVPGAKGDADVLGVVVSALRRLGLVPRVVVGSVAVVDRVLPPTAEVRACLDRRDGAALLALPEVQALDPRRRAAAVRLLSLSGGPDVIDAARATLPGCDDALDELAELCAALPDVDVTVDLAHVRAPTYYTGAVFDVFVDGVGVPVAGGGRYDGLVGRYGPDRAAVGVAVRLDAVVAARQGGAGRPDGALVVALPKGRLLKGLLARLGARGPSAEDLASRRLLFPVGDVVFLPLKDPDVPAYVARGIADIGVVGSDVLLEGDHDVLVPRRLSLGACRLCLAGRPDLDLSALHAAGRLRVASKYPTATSRWLAARGHLADVVQLSGSVEVSVLTGLADAIVDVVETGSTLKENGLVVHDTVAEISARIVVNRAALALRGPKVAELLSLLEDPCAD